MRKRTNAINKSKFQNNGRRRQLLKRVHKKIVLRRQQFQVMEFEQCIKEAG
ncbi:MAG: hypothetical protein ACI965_002376 [Paraglaciecola sp.]|jgi:hypothetical protein